MDFWVEVDINLMEVMAYHNEEKAVDEDPMAPHAPENGNTGVYMRNGDLFSIDTKFETFRGIYRKFWKRSLDDPKTLMPEEHGGSM